MFRDEHARVVFCQQETKPMDDDDDRIDRGPFKGWQSGHPTVFIVVVAAVIAFTLVRWCAS
jgi:hypothetical protein